MAASNGTMILRGKSGRTYSVDLYIPDATGTQVTFNSSSLAVSTSPTTWRTPEDCTIIDMVAVAAPTATVAALNVNGAVANGGVIRWTNQLTTLANRAALTMGVRGGDFIGFLQA